MFKDIVCSADWAYRIMGNSVEIIGYIGSGGHVKIPMQIEGKPVIEIGRSVFDKYDFKLDSHKSVSVTEICADDNNEFYSSEDGVLFNKSKTVLLRVPPGKSGAYIVPDSVVVIDKYAFEDCANLTSITIPGSVWKSPTLSGFNLNKCKNLAEIRVAENNMCYSSEDGVLYDKFKTILFKVPNTKSGTYTVPDGVVTIEDNAFSGCANLTSITIPGSAYRGRLNFDKCKNLAEIHVAKNNMWYSSEDGVLYDKSKTTLVCVPKAKSGTYTVPAVVESIDLFVFQNCVNLTSIIIQSNVYIDDSMFENCVNLTSVVLPEGTEIISWRAFWGCVRLTSVRIPNSVKKISSIAFQGCESLSSISIPEGVTLIGEGAFDGCKSLRSVDVPDSVRKISGSRINVFNGCENLSEIRVGDNNKFYSSEDGVLFNKDKTTLIQFPDGKSGAYTIPDGVTKINAQAFGCCKNLTSITFPQSVESVKARYFNNCENLISVVIPKSVKLINPKSFVESCEIIRE